MPECSVIAGASKLEAVFKIEWSIVQADMVITTVNCETDSQG